MLYDDFNKWKTDELASIKCKIVNAIDEPTYYQKGFVYRAGLGDFIKEYITHLSIPKWRRSSDWKITEKRFREILNELKFEWSDVR